MSEDPNASTNPPSNDESLGQVISRLGPAAWLGIAWGVLPIVAGVTLLANMTTAQDLLVGTDENPGLPLGQGIAVFTAIYIFSAGVGILPTRFQAILAGFAFGVRWGLPAVVVGYTGAAIVGYLIARLIARDRIEAEIHKHKKAEIIRDAFIRHGYWKALGILTLLRVPPNSPFSLTNYAMSVSGVRVVPFLIATLVGMAPRMFVAVWIGAQFDSWDEIEKPKWLILTGVAIAVVVVIVLGVIANKAIEQAVKAGELPAEDES